MCSVKARWKMCSVKMCSVKNLLGESTARCEEERSPLLHCLGNEKPLTKKWKQKRTIKRITLTIIWLIIIFFKQKNSFLCLGLIFWGESASGRNCWRSKSTETTILLKFDTYFPELGKMSKTFPKAKNARKG